MRQMHRRLADEQVRFVLQKYDAGALSPVSAQSVLGVGKTRFFALLHAYRQDPDGFSIAYQRSSPDRLPSEVEEAMRRELLRDRALIEDPELPITDYNYSALRDRLRREGITVSLTTVIARAKSLGCYRHRPRRKAHDRQVLTNSIGSLVQHDASTHRWSPYADAKWTLIASLDDYSRKLLYAKFVPQETTWAHIEAVRSLVQSYGLPLAYYVDSLRVFRFVQHRDSVWRRQVLGNDEADPQWKQVMQLLGIDVVYALSPQAKGKIERPFRWLQDRIVRTCALEQIASLDAAQQVLEWEVQRYNRHQRHSTTGELPDQRFAKALASGNSLFRPFRLPLPYTAPEDVFCLRQTRITDGYRHISLANQDIAVPRALPHQEIDLHLVPDVTRQTMQVRMWQDDQLLGTTSLPLDRFRVHF